MKPITGKDLVAFAKKQPVSVACGVVSLILAAVLYFRADAVDEQTKIHDEKQAEAKRLNTNIKNSKDLQKEFDQILAANKEIQERAVRPKETSLNLQYFYKIEAAAGVKEISTRSLGPILPSSAKGPPPKTTYVADAYSLMVSGDFRQAVDLVRRIETGPRFSRFSNVVFATTNRDVETGAEPTAKLTLNANVELLAIPPATVTTSK